MTDFNILDRPAEMRLFLSCLSFAPARPDKDKKATSAIILSFPIMKTATIFLTRLSRFGYRTRGAKFS